MAIYQLGDKKPVIPASCFVAESATIIGDVTLGERVSVLFGAVLRGDNDWITIGEGSNVQDNSVIHADPGLPVVLGNGVTVGHRAIIHSAVVGDYSLIGMGATLLNRARIGSHCVIGAGALVAEGKEFADGSLALGSPARVVRALDEEQRRQLEHSANIYIANAARFRENLSP